jgi:hypothetical protein
MQVTRLRPVVQLLQPGECSLCTLTLHTGVPATSIVYFGSQNGLCKCAVTAAAQVAALSKSSLSARVGSSLLVKQFTTLIDQT